MKPKARHGDKVRYVVSERTRDIPAYRRIYGSGEVVTLRKDLDGWKYLVKWVGVRSPLHMEEGEIE